MNDLADLVRRWQTGWSQARDWNSYAEIDGIIEVRIGLQDRMAEYVLADDGPDDLAAGGRMAVNGTDAVADMILTDPAHRRRGLGRAVMGALVAGAIDQGAIDGLLMASADGLHLYRALGWSVVADVVVARSGQGIAGSSDQRPAAQ